MATSGWQNEQWIHTIQAEIYFTGNVHIDGITHSGNSLRVWGTIAFCARGTSGWSGWFNAGVYAAAVNQPDGQILGNNSRLYVGSDVYRAFDVTISGVSASTTSYSFGVRYHSEYFDKTLYWGLSFNAGGSAPSTPVVTLVSCEDTSAVINVSINSYGDPSTSNNRYIEAAVLGGTGYSAPRRFQKVYRETSADITVSNSSETDSTPLTIRGNTQYKIGGYASNTALSAYTIGSTFITKPARPTIAAVDQGHGQIDFTVSHATEGAAETVVEEYSTDGGATWNTITGSAFTLNLASQTVVTVRRGNSAGYMSETVTVTPTFICGIYASVINKTAAIKKVYAPVNGEAKKVSKIYASVGGKTTLVFEDPS